MIPDSAWDKALTVGRFTLDLETTGLDPETDTITGLALGVSNETWFADFRAQGDSSWVALSRSASPILRNPTLTMVGHNLKFDVAFLEANGLPVRNKLADTMLSAFLLDERRPSFALKKLAVSLLGKKEVIEYDAIAAEGMFLTPERFAEYGLQDGALTTELFDKLSPELDKQGLTKLYTDLECPAIYPIMQMERNGIAIDLSVLRDRAKQLEQTVLDEEERIFALAKHPFDIGSPAQLTKVLYRQMGLILPEGIPCSEKTGQESTDKEVLVPLKLAGHKIAGHILEWRKASKELSTYALPLQKIGVASDRPDIAIIHANFRQTGTKTGRLACASPNLQNIPRGSSIRSAFVSRYPGGTLLKLDYSQIQLRLLAHYSEDPEMTRVYLAGEDIHQKTADACGCRRNPIAKNLNFGIAFGLSPEGVWSQLRVNDEVELPVADCIKFHRKWHSTYSGVRDNYWKKQIHRAKKYGYVSTITKRKRRVNHVSSNDLERGHWFNVIINSPIQGSEGDIMKLAMRNIWRKQQEDPELAKALLVAQVHDELVFDIPADGNIEYIRGILTHEMENVLKLKVPIVVECKVGENWADTK